MTIFWPKSSEGYERDTDDPLMDEILMDNNGSSINPTKSKNGPIDVHYRSENGVD